MKLLTDNGNTLRKFSGVCKPQQQQKGAQDNSRLSDQQSLDNDSKTVHRTVACQNSCGFQAKMTAHNSGTASTPVVSGNHYCQLQARCSFVARLQKHITVLAQISRAPRRGQLFCGSRIRRNYRLVRCIALCMSLTYAVVTAIVW
jgi:hypothetical protein